MRYGRTHGYFGTGIYQAWADMHRRCRNPKTPSFKNYGGRGITVCARWYKFENFLADMGERPEGLTLDRYPNNDGNYEPGNCRWATVAQQNANRRNGWTPERRLRRSQQAKEWWAKHRPLRA